MSDVNANIGVNIDSSQALAELKRLQRQISEFNLSIVKSNQAAALAQQALQRNFINNINSIGAFSAELRTVNTTAESFTKALEGNKLSMREYFRYAGASTKTFGQNFKAELNTISKVAEERVKTLQTQYIKMGRDANGAMKAIAVRPLVLDMDSLATKTQLAAQKQALFNQLVKQGSTNLLNFGKNTQWAGRQLMVGFTLPLVAFGAAAAKSFQQLETEVIKFRKVYGDLGTNQQETDAALKNIQALAQGYTKYGVEVSKTVGLASQAAAAGFKNADLMAQTEAATKLAILGQIDQQQALETTISLQNAFKISSTELAGTIDFLNAVENQTVTSLDDITTAIPKVAPVIQSLGGDVKDLAFFLTAMKEGGINASEGANALKSGLASLINPSNKANAMLSSMGINIDNIVSKNQGNLKATVVEFATALDKLDPLSRARAIETLFGKFQFARISTLLSNVIDQGNQASRVLDLAGQSASNLASLTEKELGITAESALVKFQAAMAKLKASLAPVGEVFMKAVAPVIEFVSRILDRFNDLSEGTKKFIAITVGVIGGLGPIVLMTFGLLANGVANIIKLFAVLRNGYQRLTGQSSNLGEQTQYLTNEQLDAAAAAHSLEQSHARLTQQFSVETTAVNQLRNAYQQALTAGAAFAKLNPAMMRTPKNFADGGVVVSGPGGPKDDMVPANLSNGEVVLSVDTVNKNRSIVAGLLSNRSISIPGYAANPGSVVGSIAENFLGTRVGRSASGGEKAQVNIPGGYQLGHFAEPIQMTGAELRASVANEAQSVKRAVDALINSVGGSLEAVFDVFTNQVTVQSKDLNQLLGETGSGKTAPVSMFRSEAVGQAGAYNAPLIKEMQKAGASPEEVRSAVKQLATEFESGISKLGDVATVTAEDVNKITQEAYDRVAESNKAVRTAKENLARPGAIKEKTGVTSGRVSFAGGYNTSTVKKGINDVVQAQAPGLYPTQQAFNFTGDAARKAGIQNARAIRMVFDQLDAEAKTRIFKLVGDIDAMSQQVVAEAQRSGIDIGKYAVQGVAQGAQTASPSEATRRTAKDIIEGLRMELAAGQNVVAAAGTKVGQTAVQSVDIAVAKGVKNRRVTFRPQGPAPIGPEVPAGATMLPIIAADILSRQSDTGTDKGVVAGKKGLISGKGMVGGMGLMAGSMAIGSLPEFTGKAMLQSSLNMASMGAMFGPWGMAAGAAIGLVTSGLSTLIEKEKEQKAMAEAVFKPSAEFANYFGNTVEDVNISIANFSSKIVDLNQKVDTLGKTFGITNEQLSAFQEMVNSLPEDNPLRQLIDGLTDEDNVDKVKELTQAFIATRVALGEIKTDQAQKALDLVLAASGHTDLLGQVFVGFATRTQAVSQNLQNAATDVNTLGNALALLAGTASNAQSLQELQAIIDGIAQSGISASMAISGLFAAFKGAKNQQGQDLVEGLSTIEGIQGQDLVRAYVAVNNGLNLKTNEKTTREELINLLNDFDNSRKFVKSETQQTTALKAQIKSKEGQIKLLEKQKKLIDDQLKKEKEISDELKKQNDYKQEQSSLDQKIAEAKMSGNYIEATILEQQKRGNTAEFAQDAKVTDLQKQSDALAEKIALIQESNQELANKVSENTDATNSNTAALTDQGSYRFTPSTEVTPREQSIITESNKPAVNSLIIDPKTGKPRTVTGDEGRSPIAPQTVPGEKRVFNNDPHWDEKDFKIFTPQQVWEYFRLFPNKQYQGVYYFEPGGTATKGRGGEYAGRWYGGTDVPGMFSAYATGGEVKHFEPGGNVRGPGTGTSDSIPAMLSNGEYVVKASAVSQYGVPLLHAINSQKFNTGGFVQKFGTGGMPQMPTEDSSFKLLMKQKDRFLPEALKAFKKQYGDNTMSSPSGFGPGTWTELSLGNYVRDNYLKLTQANRLNDYAKNMTRYNMHNKNKFADGGYIQKFGTGGMPSPFSIGMSKVGDFFRGAQDKVVNPLVNNPVTRFVKNEMLGVDDLQTAWRKAKAGDDFGAMKASAASATELGLNFVGAPFIRLLPEGSLINLGKKIATPFKSMGSKLSTSFNFAKQIVSLPSRRRAETAAVEEAQRIRLEEDKKNGVMSLWDSLDFNETNLADNPWAGAPTPPNKSLLSKIIDPAKSAGKFLAKPITTPAYYAKTLFDDAKKAFGTGNTDRYRWTGNFDSYGRQVLAQEAVSKIFGSIGKKFNPKAKIADTWLNTTPSAGESILDYLTPFQRLMVSTTGKKKGLDQAAYSNILPNLKTKYLDPLVEQSLRSMSAMGAAPKSGVDAFLNKTASFKDLSVGITKSLMYQAKRKAKTKLDSLLGLNSQMRFDNSPLDFRTLAMTGQKELSLHSPEVAQSLTGAAKYFIKMVSPEGFGKELFGSEWMNKIGLPAPVNRPITNAPSIPGRKDAVFYENTGTIASESFLEKGWKTVSKFIEDPNNPLKFDPSDINSIIQNGMIPQKIALDIAQSVLGHSDFHKGNQLIDPATGRLGMLDFEQIFGSAGSTLSNTVTALKDRKISSKVIKDAMFGQLSKIESIPESSIYQMLVKSQMPDPDGVLKLYMERLGRTKDLVEEIATNKLWFANGGMVNVPKFHKGGLAHAHDPAGNNIPQMFDAKGKNGLDLTIPEKEKGPSWWSKVTTKDNWKAAFGGQNQGTGPLFEDMQSKILTYTMGLNATNRYRNNELPAGGEYLTAFAGALPVTRFARLGINKVLAKAGSAKAIPGIGEIASKMYPKIKNAGSSLFGKIKGIPNGIKDIGLRAKELLYYKTVPNQNYTFLNGLKQGFKDPDSMASSVLMHDPKIAKKLDAFRAEQLDAIQKRGFESIDDGRTFKNKNGDYVSEELDPVAWDAVVKYTNAQFLGEGLNPNVHGRSGYNYGFDIGKFGKKGLNVAGNVLGSIKKKGLSGLDSIAGNALSMVPRIPGSKTAISAITKKLGWQEFLTEGTLKSTKSLSELASGDLFHGGILPSIIENRLGRMLSDAEAAKTKPWFMKDKVLTGLDNFFQGDLFLTDAAKVGAAYFGKNGELSNLYQLAVKGIDNSNILDLRHGSLPIAMQQYGGKLLSDIMKSSNISAKAKLSMLLQEGGKTAVTKDPYSMQKAVPRPEGMVEPALSLVKNMSSGLRDNIFTQLQMFPSLMKSGYSAIAHRGGQHVNPLDTAGTFGHDVLAFTSPQDYVSTLRTLFSSTDVSSILGPGATEDAVKALRTLLADQLSSVKVPKFHSWNGPIPGPYGQELGAVLKSGTEGVYQEDYMNRLRRDADINSSTSNSNTVYNIDMVVNGGGANANEIANQVMMKIKNISDKNNTSNKVAF